MPNAAPATQVFTERQTCRACDVKALTEVLDLGTQVLPRFVTEATTDLPKAPLRLCQCANCGLLQLHHTVKPDLLYREFWYRSGINQTMREALLDVVTTGIHYHNNGSWLDIGANDGYLLSRVPESFRKVACEPARNFGPELQELSDRVIEDYFTADDEQYDVITSIAMFYDLDRPQDFLQDIHKSLKPGGIWINQLNDAPAMIRQHAFDAICHEHLCYYDIPSLNRMYQEAGLVIVQVSFNDVNGGSVRIVAKRSADNPIATDLLGLPAVHHADAQKFGAWVKRWKTVTTELIGNLSHKQEMWGYGASTKGCVLLQYLDLPHGLLGPIADRNPTKSGLYMVGKWRITDEATLRKRRPRYALALPWAFRDEFLDREASLRENGTSLVFPLPNLEICP